jgi:hypothetical protein
MALAVLRPWLNGASELFFWLALAIVVGIAVGGTAMTVRRT